MNATQKAWIDFQDYEFLRDRWLRGEVDGASEFCRYWRYRIRELVSEGRTPKGEARKNRARFNWKVRK